MKLSTTARKKFRVRNKLKKVSSNQRYRLTVSRSLKNISAQIVDDKKNITLLSATSNDKNIKKIDAKFIMIRLIEFWCIKLMNGIK